MNNRLPFLYLLLGLALAFASCSHTQAQTKGVIKTISTNGLTEDLAVPSGRTLTVKSGATLTVEEGATVNGLEGGGGGGLDNLASSISGGTVTLGGTLTTGRTWTFPDAAGTFASQAWVGAGYQPLDSDLTSLAALSTTSFGRGLLELANAAALRTSAGLVIGTDVQAYNANTTILGSSIDLTSEVTGILPMANGGTGANLTDPGGDRILFWDDSAGAVTWLQLGSNLSITGTTLNATGGGGSGLTNVDSSISGGTVTLGGTLTTGRTWTFPDAAGTFASQAWVGAGYQPLDSDLTTIAGLSAPMTGIAFLVRPMSGAWQISVPQVDTPDTPMLRVDGTDGTTGIEFSSVPLGGGSVSTIKLLATADLDGEEFTVRLPGEAGTLALQSEIPTRGSGVDEFLATPSSANLRTALTDETGTGSAVFSIAPTLAQGTITDAQAALTVSSTWNDAADTMRGVEINVTDTASASASTLLRATAGGSSYLELRKDGSLRLLGNGSAVHRFRGEVLYGVDDTGMNQTAAFGPSYGFFIGSGLAYNINDQVYLRAGGSGILALHNTTTAQKIELYETRTDGSNYERLTITAAAGTNQIKPEAAGTGTASAVEYWTTAGGVRLMAGSGTPESAVTAPVGTLYQRTDGGASTVLYAKETGSGNTGWVAYGAPEAGEGGEGLDNITSTITGNTLTLSGTLTGARNIAVPDASGTFALTSDLSAYLTTATAASTYQPLDSDLTALAALIPTKGNLLVGNGSAWVAVGVGDDDDVLTADASESAGMKWAAPSGGGGGLSYFTEALATASPNNTVNVSSLTASGGTTNQDAALSPKGTGAVLAQIPDGTATAGNKRGTYATDWQALRAVNTQVASGAYGVIGGGNRNTASGQESTVGGGRGNTASGLISTVVGGRDCVSSGAGAVSGGFQAQATGEAGVSINSGGQATAAYSSAWHYRPLADRYGMAAWASGYFAAIGDSQTATFTLRNKTTDATPTELFLDGASLRLTIPAGKVCAFAVVVQGVKSDGSSVAFYERRIQLKNVSATTSAVFSAVTIGTDNAAGTALTVDANDTNDALRVQVTGVASETWRWSASVTATETAYGN